MIGTNLVQQPGSTNNLVQQTTCFTNLVQQTTTRSTFLLITFNIDHVQHFVQQLTLFRSTFISFGIRSGFALLFVVGHLARFALRRLLLLREFELTTLHLTHFGRAHLARCPSSEQVLRARWQSTLAEHVGQARWPSTLAESRSDIRAGSEKVKVVYHRVLAVVLKV